MDTVVFSYPQQGEGVLLLQLRLHLVQRPLQAGDLHAEQRLVLVQADQLAALLCLQLHLQQLLLLVQELVQVAELGLDALLQVRRVLLGQRSKVTGLQFIASHCSVRQHTDTVLHILPMLGESTFVQKAEAIFSKRKLSCLQ